MDRNFEAGNCCRALAIHNLVGSMGRVASRGDNAAMESFFSLLQKNVQNRRSWDTREQLRIAIVTRIERNYHRRRRQARLGRLTPIEFETIMNNDLALAAQPELSPVPASDPCAARSPGRRIPSGVDLGIRGSQCAARARSDRPHRDVRTDGQVLRLSREHATRRRPAVVA